MEWGRLHVHHLPTSEPQNFCQKWKFEEKGPIPILSYLVSW